MGINPGAEYAVLRFSFGPFTTEDEVSRAGQAAVRAAARARDVVAS
jgi:cysteine sulfinate desulfinase/cysteine desulfurase-like protein